MHHQSMSNRKSGRTKSIIVQGDGADWGSAMGLEIDAPGQTHRSAGPRHAPARAGPGVQIKAQILIGFPDPRENCIPCVSMCEMLKLKCDAEQITHERNPGQGPSQLV